MSSTGRTAHRRDAGRTQRATRKTSFVPTRCARRCPVAYASTRSPLHLLEALSGSRRARRGARQPRADRGPSATDARPTRLDAAGTDRARAGREVRSDAPRALVRPEDSRANCRVVSTRCRATKRPIPIGQMTSERPAKLVSGPVGGGPQGTCALGVGFARSRVETSTHLQMRACAPACRPSPFSDGLSPRFSTGLPAASPS